MNAPYLHLVTVHLPVVGLMAALVILIASQFRKDEFLNKLGYSFVLFCAVTACIAYFTGGATYESLESRLTEARPIIEDHAIIGRAAFVGMILLGVAVLSAFFQYWQEEKPAAWHRWAILIATVALCYILAWTAHLGGQVRHDEIRGVPSVFPALP